MTLKIETMQHKIGWLLTGNKPKMVRTMLMHKSMVHPRLINTAIG
jgi:hypothetical protein